MAERNVNNATKDQAQVAKLHKTLHDGVLSNDGVLRFDFMTSLQNIVMAKIIISLWINQYAELKIKSVGIWDLIENNVVTQVSQLLLPEYLKRKLASIVPLIGDSIFNWVMYNDFIFNRYGCLPEEQIGNIAWTARGKIDYAQTARNILANQHNTLNYKLKYDLACTYCLENEIYSLATGRSYLHWIDFETNMMVRFWTPKTRHNGRRLNISINYGNNEKISTVETLFRLFMRKDKFLTEGSLSNEESIKYMWNRFTEEQKDKSIISAVKQLVNQDLRYSLLSSLNYVQQQKVLRECSGIILGDIFNDWLWGEYFLPTALHTLPIMDSSSYLDILNKIIKEMVENYKEGNINLCDQYKSIFKELWINSPWHLKDYLFSRGDGYFIKRLLITSLSWERDIDVIALLFKDLSSQQKKEIIFSDEGMLRCVNYIQRNRWDLLELFIDYTLHSEDKAFIKQRIMQDKGRRIVSRLLKREALDEVDYFLSWGFKCKEEVDEFKLSLTNCDTLLKSIVDKSNADYAKVSNLFEWCSNGDQELMNRLKVEFPTSVTGKYFIMKLVTGDNYDLLDEFLNWCFLNNEKRVATFKSNLHKDRYFVQELASILREKEKHLKMLRKFINWSSNNKKGIRKLISLFIPNRVLRSYSF